MSFYSTVRTIQISEIGNPKDYITATVIGLVVVGTIISFSFTLFKNRKVLKQKALQERISHLY